MYLLDTLEDYCLDLIINYPKNDEIYLNRINSFILVSNDNESINFLIESIKEYFIFKSTKKFNDYNKLYLNCLTLLKNKDYYKIKKIYKIINKLSIPSLYQYFFEKLIIEIDIEYFNENYSLCEEYLDAIPPRTFIKNNFDLINDIENVLKYVSRLTCDNKGINIKNANNNIINYEYFINLLIYNINIIPKYKKIYQNIEKDLIKVLDRIKICKKINIPFKIKSGFI